MVVTICEPLDIHLLWTCQITNLNFTSVQKQTALFCSFVKAECCCYHCFEETGLNYPIQIQKFDIPFRKWNTCARTPVDLFNQIENQDLKYIFISLSWRWLSKCKWILCCLPLFMVRPLYIDTLKLNPCRNSKVSGNMKICEISCFGFCRTQDGFSQTQTPSREWGRGVESTAVWRGSVLLFNDLFDICLIVNLI